MELIYIYIDNYRNKKFQNQKISFSDRFRVDYNEKSKSLTIEVKKFVNLYPYNICMMNAIVGKNASGKTSLLDLIGEEITDRENIESYTIEGDIYKSLSDSLSGTKPVFTKNDKDSYFLLYYVGKDEKGKDYFAFETCDIEKYATIFENSRDKIEEKAKDWFFCYFQLEGEKILYKGNGSGPIGLQDKTTILSFKHNRQRKNFFSTRADSDSGIIERKTINIGENLLADEIKFLIEQMGIKKRESFKNNTYTLRVDLNKAKMYLDQEDIIEPYNKENLQELSENQKYLLKFTYGYACFALNAILRDGRYDEEQKKKCLKCISEIRKNVNTYEEWKDYYHNVINVLFEKMNYEGVTLESYIKIEEALETFFENAEKNKIILRFRRDYFKISLTKESDISTIQDVIRKCLDEATEKNMIKEDSIILDYLDTSIEWLSAGERETLSLYTSISDGISEKDNSHSYILLLDEMERSMHPEMCRTLVYDLMHFLKQYENKAFQVILSTHSPFIIGDIFNENVVELDRKGQEIKVRSADNATFGQNIHVLLKNTFFLEHTFGEFARLRMMNILSYLSKEEMKWEEIKELNKDEIRSFLEENIARVGEEILREHMEELFRMNFQSIDEQIEFHQEAIRKLQEKKQKENVYNFSKRRTGTNPRDSGDCNRSFNKGFE